MNYDISILIPVYNSRQTLRELVESIDAVCKALEKNYQLVLVDDGSKDGSWSEIEQLKKEKDKQILAVKLTKNFGQHNALLCGFNFCRGGLIITMDDDLQHPPEEIKTLLQKYNDTNADVVYGVPVDKKHSLVRNTGSKIVSTTSEYADKNEPWKKGSSFRLMKKEIVENIKENFSSNFLFLDAVINWSTGNIEHVAVKHNPRKSGRSGYTSLKLTKLYFNILINYSATPLRYMTYFGLFASFVSFMFGIRFIYRKLVHNVPLGYTSLIVSILFSTGLIMFCLGIIGEYLYKVYQLQSKRPPFLIKETLR